MIIWYTARAGCWLHPETVEYFGGTYKKTVIIKQAQEKANKTGLPVTVYGDNTNRTFVIFPEKKGGR
jgi:hypothetical protein